MDQTQNLRPLDRVLRGASRVFTPLKRHLVARPKHVAVEQPTQSQAAQPPPRLRLARLLPRENAGPIKHTHSCAFLC